MYRFINGDYKELYADGKSVYWFSESKTLQTTHPDGLKTMEFPNGQVEKKFPNGSVEVTYPDRTVRTVFPNGTVIDFLSHNHRNQASFQTVPFQK
jgi:centromere protein J